MTSADWVPDSVDVNTPSQARMYDYALGGSHNFAVDREAAEKVLRANPDGRMGMFANRSFLRRAVRFLAGAGVSQFLDIGSGIPTVGNVHEVAQRADPRARCVYVDIDPMAVAVSRSILRSDPRTTAIRADIRDAEEIVDDPEVHGLLDMDRPVALLMLCVLHFIPDADDPWGLIRRYRDRLPSGSYLVISHVTDDSRSGAHADAMKVYSNVVKTVRMRSREEVTAMFDGFELVDPGVEWVARWRPDPDDHDHDRLPLLYYSGVARKP